jgi:hypothetical protein
MWVLLVDNIFKHLVFTVKFKTRLIYQRHGFVIIIIKQGASQIQSLTINVREYQRGNQKWTIQRKWQHWVVKWILYHSHRIGIVDI